MVFGCMGTFIRDPPRESLGGNTTSSKNYLSPKKCVSCSRNTFEIAHSEDKTDIKRPPLDLRHLLDSTSLL